MRDRWDDSGARVPVPRAEKRHSRIRADLENKGVAPEFSQSVADRLATIAPDFSSEEYSAILDGVAAAYGVHRRDREAVRDASSDVDEIQRLMLGFAGELRKLEEGLQILSAYVHRMRTRAAREHTGLLH
jgi:hypothetical protein